jgi:hypothetical protein
MMNHTIVAMVGEKIARVECNTCHGVHNYHQAKESKEVVAGKDQPKKAATPRTAKVDPAVAAAAEWAALLENRDPAKAIPYDMNGKFRRNDLLLHSLFGVGIVQLIQVNKIDVLFQEGKKRLRAG